MGEFGFVLVLNINLPQVAYARLEGDYIVCAAYSHELPRYSDNYFFFALDQSAVLWSRSNLGRLPYRLRGKKFVKPVKDYYFTYLIVYLLFVVCVKIAIFD